MNQEMKEFVRAAKELTDAQRAMIHAQDVQIKTLTETLYSVASQRNALYNHIVKMRDDGLQSHEVRPYCEYALRDSGAV